jgi:NDP-sugar pyrophosphorylase family protein
LKAVILAGGLGTRISEETHLRPKPMVEGVPARSSGMDREYK